ncbi:hypothetical protein [Streptomyces nitrosporeus]|uniref:Uncharacterized protein n=1 Tax=Streptomyces nitrosporeus TaxID=28894 RepID=A0A5J6FIU9_9ACTN|nr:hypothetical protein [Streptomyces nitrosporeus]QEU75901.1 hypothetical protein CP967_31545 [Streptomyces nitrosporeus]GGY89252.1 hypothetical protein GCM10010327_20060 [Streptomyces nitrosporeus]
MDNRSLEALGLHVAPRDQPLVYPGAWPVESGLLYRGRLLRLRPGRARRLAQWLVDSPAEGFGGGTEPGEAVPLDYALMRANEPLAGERFPVLSVGSNACPAQLKHKMDGHGLSSTIPMVKVRTVGIDIGVSAYVSPLGYVSSSPFHAPHVTRDLFVTWFDATQLEVVDASEGVFTEGGEYDRVLLPGTDFRFELPSGELLGGVYAYVHRYGVLHDGTGTPRPHNGERRLLTELLAESRRLREWFGDTPEQFSSQARGNEQLCEKGTRLFRDEGRTTPSGLEGHVPERPAAVVYDDIQPANPLPAGSHRVARTPDTYDQRGSGVVRLSAGLAADLRHPEHVVLQNAQVPPARRERLGALANVVVAPELDPDDRRTVQVDRSLRICIGVEPGEDIAVRPAALPRTRRRWRNALFGPLNYVTCRVQDGDRASAEHEVCLLDALTLELLGVSSGDDVVVEGFPGSDGIVPTLQLKAIQTSEEVIERRKDLHGGDLTSRYPSSLDALGTYPDLPWVFLDRRLWAGLGVQGQWLATVRIRCSRTYQLKKELREMMFLLGLAFIGVVTVLESNTWRVISLAVLVLLAGSLVSIRLRSRLTQRARRIGGAARR